MKATLLLANGDIYEGKSFGAEGTAFGEICFNTSMAGYQEILTDPSYAEQVIVMTYPEIGNYGINDYDFESDRVHAKGFIVKNYCEVESHYRSTQKLSKYLKNNGVIAISGVDTRTLTTTIRDIGAVPCVVTTKEITEEIREKLKTWEMNKDVAVKCSTEFKYQTNGSGVKIAFVDLGLKRSILKYLVNMDCDITIFPANTSADELLAINPDAVLLSNGPGNPEDAVGTIETAKNLIGKVPVYGICLGYQILSIVLGAKTYKLKYGHRGGNHPVIDVRTNKVILTSQNHGYAVDEKSLPKTVIATHKNLNDDTLEGFICPSKNIAAVQFHPEASPGPCDAAEILYNWIKEIEDKKCQRI